MCGTLEKEGEFVNRLSRSGTNTMIAGVCGGLGEHLGIDPTLVRLVFILMTIFSGLGLLLYLLLLILMPPAAGRSAPAGSPGEGQAAGSRNSALLLGMVLIVFGAALLLHNMGFSWFRWFGWRTLWPLLLIAVGLAVLVRPAKGE